MRNVSLAQKYLFVALVSKNNFETGINDKQNVEKIFFGRNGENKMRELGANHCNASSAN